MVGNLRSVEDGSYVGHGLQTARRGLVVDHTDALLTSRGVADAIETVDEAANGCAYGLIADNKFIWHIDGLLESEDGKRRETAVGLYKQTHIFYDDLTVDELQTVEIQILLIQFCTDGIVDGPFYGGAVVEQSVE